MVKRMDFRYHWEKSSSFHTHIDLHLMRKILWNIVGSLVVLLVVLVALSPVNPLRLPATGPDLGAGGSSDSSADASSANSSDLSSAESSIASSDASSAESSIADNSSASDASSESSAIVDQSSASQSMSSGQSSNASASASAESSLSASASSMSQGSVSSSVSSVSISSWQSSASSAISSAASSASSSVSSASSASSFSSRSSSSRRSSSSSLNLPPVAADNGFAGRRVGGIASQRVPHRIDELEDLLRVSSSSASSATPAQCTVTIRGGAVAVTIGGRETVFGDVPASMWYADAVGCMLEFGIVSGVGDAHGQMTGMFAPDKTVTYGELAKMSVLLSRKNTELHAAGAHWAAPYVAAARTLGITVFDDVHDLDAEAPRGAVIQAVVQAIGFPVTSDTGLLVFYQNQGMLKDVSFSDPRGPAIAIATSLDIVTGDRDETGTTNGYIRPNTAVTRAEIAVMMARALGIYYVERK